MSETLNSSTAQAGAAGGEPGSTLKKASWVLIALGGLLSLAALFTDADRFGFAYLWGFTFVWAVVLGSLFFVALHHLTRAVWSVPFRRVAEMLCSPVPMILILFIPLALFTFLSDSFSVFPWANPEVVEGDHILEGKTPYLNSGFFAIRGLVFIGLWFLFSRFFLKASLRQDTLDPDEAATRRLQRWSAPFMLIFALTVTFAAFDWLMSLEPHWFSTIFGVYVFAGMVLTALSVLTLAVIWLQKQGRLGDGIVTGHHYYSLGALLFAFTCFWTYIAFSQFMLIWYGNIPEETVYFVHRGHHGWLEVSVALVVIRFVIPFFLLLSRPAKMNTRRLKLVSVICLLGQLLDLYWLIMPQLHHEAPRLGWQEFGPLLLMGGIMIFLFVRMLGKHPTLPEKDPYFEKTCAFHL